MTDTDTPAVTIPTPSARAIHAAAVEAGMTIKVDSIGPNVGSFAVFTADGHYLFGVYFTRRYPSYNTTWRPNQKARWHTTIRSGGDTLTSNTALNMIFARREEARRLAERAALSPAERLAADVAECRTRIERNQARALSPEVDTLARLAAAQNAAWWTLNLARLLAESMNETQHGNKIAEVRSQITMNLDLDPIRAEIDRLSR